MGVTRIACGVCESSSWDVDLTEEKAASHRQHRLYMRNLKDKNGERVGAEDPDFKCPACGELQRLVGVVV